MSRVTDLVSELIYQYPTGITTHAPCAAGCGKFARGGHMCRECLQAELLTLGVDKNKIVSLTVWLETLQALENSQAIRYARYHVIRLRDSITENQRTKKCS